MLISAFSPWRDGARPDRLSGEVNAGCPFSCAPCRTRCPLEDAGDDRKLPLFVILEVRLRVIESATRDNRLMRGDHTKLDGTVITANLGTPHSPVTCVSDFQRQDSRIESFVTSTLGSSL
jgi:hypothetical protein